MCRTQYFLTSTTEYTRCRKLNLGKRKANRTNRYKKNCVPAVHFCLYETWKIREMIVRYCDNFFSTNTLFRRCGWIILKIDSIWTFPYLCILINESVSSPNRVRWRTGHSDSKCKNLLYIISNKTYENWEKSIKFPIKIKTYWLDAKMNKDEE